jgi:2-dehydro-3-deoxy-D-arabinonate dehydratase
VASVDLPAVELPEQGLVLGERGWVVRRDGTHHPLGATLADLLAMPLDRARSVYEAAASTAREAVADGTSGRRVRAPIDRQEVWAAGVTYQRSREGRKEESGHAALYDAVYDDERPELFFKSTPERVVGPEAPVGIRADSGWDVPEAEIGLVVNSAGEIFGYTVGNDMSSRSIEGDNPLYLPQAKVYTGACALGPAIVPAWLVSGPFDIDLAIERDGATVYRGKTSTTAMARTFETLVSWLFRALDFPTGVILLTGTGVVPERRFTLRGGDQVVIDVAGLGVLRNTVTVVGAPS